MFKNFPRNLLIALRVTLVLAAVCGLIYPLAMTGIAQVAFPGQANGSLIKSSDGTIVGSSLIGECFYQPNKSHTDFLLTTPLEIATGPQDQKSGEVFYAVDPRYFQGRPSYIQTSAPITSPQTLVTAQDLTRDGGFAVVPLDPPCESDNSLGSNLSNSDPYEVQRVDTYAAYLQCLGIGAGTVSWTAAQLPEVAQDPAKYCAGAATDASPLPSDLVTGDFTSFDPDISQASALAQVNMVATERGISATDLTDLVDANVTGRSLGVLGESYVNVLQLNLALNQKFGQPPALPAPTS